MENHPATTSFCSAVLAGVGGIVFEWRRRLRSLRGEDPLSTVDPKPLLESIELLLRQLASALGRGSYDVDAAAGASAVYGQSREAQGARASDVLREFRLLKQCALDCVVSKYPGLEPGLLLQLATRADLLFDEASACALERFVESLFEGDPFEDPAFHQVDGQFHLHRELELELQRSSRHSRSFAVVIVSIGAAEISSLPGPYQPDQVLLDLMRVVRSKLRATDRIFRYNKNDFVVLCPETEPQRLTNFVARLQLAVESYKRQNSLGIEVTFGVATFPEDAKDSLSLLQVALADQSFRLGTYTC